MVGFKLLEMLGLLSVVLKCSVKRCVSFLCGGWALHQR